MHCAGVPALSASRGPVINLLAAIFAACSLIACAGSPVAQPAPGDCIQMRLWSNGAHTAIAMPVEAFDERHAVRRLFPEQNYFLVGWGARDFYMAERAGFWDGLFAILPPTQSVVHVIVGREPVEETVWRPREMVDIAISKSAARAITESIDERLVFDANDAPVIVGEGRVRGASFFLAAKGQFHFFNMCNHWTARRLRVGGVPVNDVISFTADGLLSAVKRKTPNACPAAKDAS